MFNMYIGSYNGELNTGILPDLRWSPFRQQLTVGSQYLLLQGILSEMTGFPNLSLVRLILLLCLIIYSNNLESKADLQ